MAYNAASHNITGEKTGPVSGAPPKLDDSTKNAILEASDAQGGQSAPGREHEQNPEGKQKSAKELAREQAKAEKLRKFQEKQAAKAQKPDTSKPAKEKKPKKEEEAPIEYVEETPKGDKKILGSLEDPARKAYIPKVVESAWYDWWEKEGFFKPDMPNGEVKDKGHFVIPIPPPNVTGNLHIGHALANSLQDMLIRYYRMKGYTTLFVPGCDHAGIATQAVVENMLWRREGKTRHDVGRAALLERIWDWKGEYHSKLTKVLKRMGGSYDWTREAFTMDANLSAAVQECFIRLFEEGYIYRDNRLVNWCTRLQTAMSTIEVDNKELTGRTLLDVPGYERKVEFGVIVTFKYQIEGSNDCIEVATTRIETMLGDTGIAVAPDDERYKNLVGKNAIHPFIEGRKLPIFTDEYVDKEFGTGAVKITPAHDPNDFAIGQRHKLEFINIFTDDGKINGNGGSFEGQRRFDARYAVLNALKEKGLYVETKDNAMMIPLCSRTKDVIEPMLKPQWWMRMEELSAAALKAVEDGDLVIKPDTADRSYRRWMKNVNPWCLSRQLWWGHQIPAYKVVENGEEKGWVCAKSEEEAQKKASEKFPGLKFTLERDADVLDTWFSSGLWPFSTLGWPNENALDFQKLFPTSVLETGWDILFFWVARMVMLSLKLTGKVPFKEVYCHSLVRDSEGRKMSKSLGNVVDPIDIMDGISLLDLNAKLLQGNLDPKELERATKYQKTAFPTGIPECGSDALRFSLIQYTTGGGDIAFDVKVMAGYRRFCNKVYQATKYVLGSYEKSGAGFTPQATITKIGHESLSEKWILSRFTKAVKQVNEAIEQREFSKATQFIYSLFYDELCDVFIENSKAIILEGAKEERESALNTLYNVLDGSLRLMHPFLPFLTEELWQRLRAAAPRPNDNTPSIVVAAYPEFLPELLDEESEAAYELVLANAKGIRSLIAEYKVEKASIIIQTLNSTAEETIQAQLLAVKSLSGKSWSSIDLITASDAVPKGCAVYGVSTDTAVFLKLEGDIKVEEEIKKAQGKLKKASEGVVKQRKLVEAEDFKEKVSSAVQEEEIKKLKDFEAQQKNYERTIEMFETMKLDTAR